MTVTVKTLAGVLAALASVFVVVYPLANAIYSSAGRRHFQCFTPDAGDYACRRTEWLIQSFLFSAALLAIPVGVFFALSLVLLMGVRLVWARDGRIPLWTGLAAILSAALATGLILRAR